MHTRHLSASDPVLVVGKRIDDIYSLDPAVAAEFTAGEIIHNLYDRLFSPPRDSSAERIGIAVHWRASDDLRSLTVTLRAGVRFHSGRQLGADDVVHSLTRAVMLGREPGVPLRTLGWHPGNVSEMVAATGPLTVVLRFPAPVSFDLARGCLSSRGASIVDRVEIASQARDGDWGSGWLASHSAGSGPFALRHCRPGDEVELARHDGYWHRPAGVRGVRYRHLPNPQTQLEHLLRGEIDVARDLTTSQLATLEHDAAYTLVRSTKRTLFYLALNQQVEPYTHPLVRAALRRLIDHHGIEQEILAGRFERNHAMWADDPPSRFPAERFRLDVEHARQLLAEASYPDGFVVYLNIIDAPDYIRIGESLMRTFARARITVRLTIASQAAESRLYQQRRHDAILIRWAPDFDDPHAAAMFFALNPDNGDDSAYRTAAWRCRWVDAGLNRAVLDAARRSDERERIAAYRRIDEVLAADSPFIFLFRQIDCAAVSTRFDGLTLGPLDDTASYAAVTAHPGWPTIAPETAGPDC
ncbi:ABC transporter substrate-binding protein [Burkholderia stagnalis]|uniref:ABC transporter substrate-binding protein n=1 Tax=Burkholderia stagnalis TaxID=1503054 RepID=UPI000F5F3196|nr:ABC transporter substrate-binding protein [Burkholderia stagnalis]RQY11646.1 ABC transporter substrate-binding protein [Burkholderia stagnalis]